MTNDKTTEQPEDARERALRRIEMLHKMGYLADEFSETIRACLSTPNNALNNIDKKDVSDIDVVELNNAPHGLAGDDLKTLRMVLEVMETGVTLTDQGRAIIDRGYLAVSNLQDRLAGQTPGAVPVPKGNLCAPSNRERVLNDIAVARSELNDATYGLKAQDPTLACIKRADYVLEQVLKALAAEAPRV